MKTDGSDAKQKQQVQKPQFTLKQWVLKTTDQIKNALPANITPERMTRIALTALSKDEKLAQTSPESFLGALLTSAQLGLECNTPLGQAYLIPFYNTKKQCLETQFQLGYQGLIELCYRTKQYRTIQARIVYDGDDFDYSYGMEEKLIHRPREKSEKPIYVYAYYELTTGAKSFEVMSWDAVMRHAEKYSQSVQKGYSSPWKTDPESMAKKTVLKKVLKYAPKTVEVAEAITGDSAIIKSAVLHDGDRAYISNDIESAEIIDATVRNALEDKTANQQTEAPQNQQPQATPAQQQQTAQAQAQAPAQNTSDLASQALGEQGGELQFSPEEEAALDAQFDQMPQDPADIF